jgi:hypothetical protein
MADQRKKSNIEVGGQLGLSGSVDSEVLKILERIEKNYRFLVVLILLNLIWAFLSPCLIYYWVTVLISVAIFVIGFFLSYYGLRKVKEIRSIMVKGR